MISAERKQRILANKEKLAAPPAGTVSKALKGLKGVDWKTATATTAAFMGIGGAMALGSAGAAKLGQAAMDPVKKRIGFKRLMTESPELADKEDMGTLKKYYNTLFRFAPNVAMDPLTASSFMKRNLEFKEVGIQPSDISTLADITSKMKSTERGTALRKAFEGRGMGTAPDIFK
jgi:hypothetical protein